MKFFLISFLLLFSVTVTAGKFNAVLDIGDPMPEFKNLPSVSGNALSSEQLTESIVVLVSLANHCPWVRGMDQDLINLVSRFENEDVIVIGISMNRREDDRLEAMKNHTARVGYNFEYLYDESQALGRKLGATRTPEYFVFNKERQLVYMGLLHNSPGKLNSEGKVQYINGMPDEYYVENAIKNTLKDKPVSPNETRAHGCTIKYVQ